MPREEPYHWEHSYSLDECRRTFHDAGDAVVHEPRDSETIRAMLRDAEDCALDCDEDGSMRRRPTTGPRGIVWAGLVMAWIWFIWWAWDDLAAWWGGS